MTQSRSSLSVFAVAFGRREAVCAGAADANNTKEC